MKTKAVCAVLFGIAAVGGFAGLRRSGGTASAMPSPSLKQAAIIALAAAASALPEHSSAPALPSAAANPDAVELKTALESGLIAAEFTGNGRERMTATFTTKAAALVVEVPAGQMLDSGRSTVIVVRSGQVAVAPGKPAGFTLQTAATRSGNKVGEAAYHVSYGRMPRLDALLAHVAQHRELSPGAIQTAVMALTENLPLNAVAKFSPASGDLRSRFDTSAFRVEAADIVNALSALREIGVKDGAIAMTIDPQLKIEAMIDPLAKAIAMRYYGIAPENEWAFWKTELLNGDSSTRHYALYGIARFYPDVALDMLPKWARESKTTNVFRISAIQALADTQRPEALPILRQLTDEFGQDSGLGRAAASAARYLDASLAKLAMSRTTVAFRDSKTVSQF